ncbi:hypothetical protein Agub_g6396 [Astrephomene gubernaculifera]|uniref:Uncharacterized protein n=1 Tax=Astrephomene gubernaculifera TaxID=47775 RepID=A0AAD3HLN0_9CHLO|nr:hypothetical protein Agub_g6396 [Astrephomene gubernaculifera]
MEPGGTRGPRGRSSDTEVALTPRGPVSEDVMAAIYDRATAIFSGHKHRASGMLEPSQGPYALALVGAMLGLNQKQLDGELQLTAKVGRRSLSYEEFMSACEAMVALHGALAQQQVKRLQNNDMSSALRAAFNRYVKINAGGFVGGDQRMNSNQFIKMCQDAGVMEPNGPASMSTLQLSWASCKATFGSTRLQYSQFLKILGALAAELSGDVFLLVAGLGLELPTVPPLRNGFRKPDAGEVTLSRPEVLQGVGSHVAAEEAYEKYLQEGRAPDKRDPLARASVSPIKGPRASNTGAGVPNWVKAMQADQGGASPMTSGQDIRGIPVIETPDSDDDMPRKPARKSMPPVPPDEPTPRAKASPMRPRGGKLPAMGGGDALSPPLSPELLVRSDISASSYSAPGGIRVDAGPMQVAPRPRESVRNGITTELESPIAHLEPSILSGAPRPRKSVAGAPEGFREVVEQQAAAVKALEGRVQEQQQREKELFERVQLLTDKLADAQTAVTVQSGCPGGALPDVPQGKGRTVVSGRCPLTDQVERLTEQMAEVLARLSALESIRLQPKAPNEPPPKQRNPVGARTPEFPEEPATVVPVAPSWGPPAGGRSPRMPEPDGPRVIQQLEPAVNATQGEWMSRLLLNLDKRVRLLEGSSGKGGEEGDSEALAEVLKQLRGMHPVASPAPPAPPVPTASPPSTPPPDPAFLKVDPRRKVEKVTDSVDPAPALVPTGDPELDRRLAALSNEMRSKNATVGVLLDMLNQTRGEVAALAAQLNARSGGTDGGPVVVGHRPTPPSTQPRNPVVVVDGGLAPPEGAPSISPGLMRPRRRTGEPSSEAVIPLEPHLETVMSEQQGIKRVVRELCAAIGLPPPPIVAPVIVSPSPDPIIARKASSETGMEAVQWGQPGRKTIREEAQEVKRNVEGVQADVGELKKQVEQIRAGYGFAEWPQPLRPDGSTTTTVVVPGAGPMQAAAQAGGRNPVQVTVGAPNQPADVQGFAPGRRPLQPLVGDATIAPLPDAQVHALKDELRRVKAFVGMAEAAPAAEAAGVAGTVAAAAAPAAAAAAAVEEGKWADAGRGPQPLREAVGTVATDVEGLRKHVKAMDAALRTNIANTNNLTTFLNEHAPALIQVAQQTKDGTAAAGGRYPVVAAVGEVQQQQQQHGMSPPPRHGMLPLQANGNLEHGVVDPVEYHQLRDQVRNIARFLGGPALEIGPSTQGSPAPPAPAPPSASATAAASTEPERVSVQPWAVGGRGGGAGGTVAEGLGQVSGEVEVLKKQLGQMGHALRAAGLVDPAVLAVTPGGQEVVGVSARPGGQRNAISVTPGVQGSDGLTGFAPPQQKGQAGMEGTTSLEPVVADVGLLKDDVRAVKQFLGMSDARPEGRDVVAVAPALPLGGSSNPGQAAAAAGEPWGDKGRGAAHADGDKVAFGSQGGLAQEVDAVRRRQADMEEALRRANIPLPIPLAEQDDSAVRVVPATAAAGAGAQRNAIAVSPGLVQRPDAMGFTAPRRSLQPLHTIEGVPEPVISHLGAMQDDLRRVTAFLGMQPVATDPMPVQQGQPTSAAHPMAAAAPAAAQQPWASGGREGAAGGGDAPVQVERFSDVVRDVDYNKRRTAALEEALRAAGIPIPPPVEASVTHVAAAGSPEQARQSRNAVFVTPVTRPDSAMGFHAPARRQLLPALQGLPEPAQAELSRLSGDVKRMQAFLGMGPSASGPGAAGPDAPGAAGVAASGEARSVGVEPWGAPGREPRGQAGQEPARNLGDVIKEVDGNRWRMAALEEAVRAAGIPVPTAPMATTVAVAGSSEAQSRARNPVNVTAGDVPVAAAGAVGFAPPGRKLLPALEGLPEPAQAELSRLSDDVKRMQAFLGMGPSASGPGAAGPDAARAAEGAASGEARSVGVEPWGAPGREPRLQQGQEPARNLGDIVKEVDQNAWRMAALEEAVRAAGIPVPTAPVATTVAVAGSSEAQSRARNPVNVTAGGVPVAAVGAMGFSPPGRKLLPALEGLPEPAQAELSRLSDDVKRIEAFLGMGPSASGPGAVGPDAPGVAGGAATGEARSVGVEPWGAPGREPRGQPGQEPVKSYGDVAKEVDDHARRVSQIEESLRAAGIPLQASTAVPTAVGPASGSEQQRQRNGVVVTPGLVPGPEGATGFAPLPRRGPAGAEGGAPEPLPARVEALQDDVKRIKTFLGMQDASSGAVAATPEAAAKLAGVAVAAEAGPWAGPGREKSGGAAPDAVAKELGDVKQQLEELDRALRGAGMGYMLPKDGGTGPVAVQQQQRDTAAADKSRGGVHVTSGDVQRPLDVAGLPALARKDGLPPIQNPSFVDANEYDKLKDEVERIKAFVDMKQGGAGPAAAAAVPAAAAAAAAASAGNEPWADKALREETEEARKAVKELTDDLDGLRRKLAGMEDALRSMGIPQPLGSGLTDVRSAAGSASSGPSRNPVAVSPGLASELVAQGLAPPVQKSAAGAPQSPEGVPDPVTVDPEDFKQLKRAFEELQGAVGALPQQQPQKPKTLREDTDDIKKFVRAMGKDVGAMGNDMQTLKKHMDDVEAATNRALGNLAAEVARMKAAREEERPDSADRKRSQQQPKLETAGGKMEDTIGAITALNAAQQQELARAAADGGRSEDIDALNEAMRQSENQLARLLAFLKQDVMDRFAVHEKTLIRMAKQIDYVQRLLKGEFDEQRIAARESVQSEGDGLTPGADA